LRCLFVWNYNIVGLEPTRGFSKSLIWEKQSGGLFRRRLRNLAVRLPAPKKTPKHLCFGVFAVFAFGPQSCKIERCKNQGNAEWINNIIRKAVFQNVTENAVRKTYYAPLDKIYYR